MGVFSKLKSMFYKREKTLFEEESKVWAEITSLENQLKVVKTEQDKQLILGKIEEKKKIIKEIANSNPAKLKYRIKELQDELNRVNTINIEAKALVRYYEEVVKKYASKLEEEKTVDNLKDLVKYDTTEMDVLLDTVKTNNYEYDTNYLTVVNNLYDYIKRNFYLITKKLSIKFWLESSDMLRTRSGDPLDIAIFVCSAMHALGDYNAKIYFVELDDFSTFAFVKTKYKNRILIVDPFNSENYSDLLGYESVIDEKYKPYNKKIRRVLYSFNAFTFESE